MQPAKVQKIKHLLLIQNQEKFLLGIWNYSYQKKIKLDSISAITGVYSMSIYHLIRNY